jgi:hypothetical protein
MAFSTGLKLGGILMGPLPLRLSYTDHRQLPTT